RRDGIAAVTLCRGSTSVAYADAPWLLGGVKTLSYAINMAAQREAGRRGAAEVIFYSTDGLVLEAPTATVVWRNGMTLCTTPIGDSGILAGTTAGLLFDNAAASGWRTEVTTARVADLRAAESLWLISATRGPVDVVVLDGAARPRDLERTATVRGWCGF
ncbi:MAG: aminotransferase class IV, partial [Jatrophihabitantaceae bacterium]